jgi:PAS domain S-box-containing protein
MSVSLPSALPPGGSVALADAVSARQLQQVYARLRTSAWLSIGVAVLFVGPMGLVFEPGWSLAWFVVLVVTQLARLGLWWCFKRGPGAAGRVAAAAGAAGGAGDAGDAGKAGEAAAGARNSERWRLAFIAAGALSGISWAFGPCLLLAPGAADRGALLAVVLLAVGAVAVTQLAAQWSALVAFLSTALLPTALALLAQGGELAPLLAATVCAAWAALLAVGRASHLNNAARIRTEIELAHALAAAQSLAAELHVASQQRHYESERLAHLLAATNAAGAEWNLRTGRVVLNERGVALLGLDALPAEGLSLTALAALVHAEDLPAAQAQVRAHLTGQRPGFEFEARLRHRGGHWLWARITGRATGRPASAGDARPAWVTGTFIDLSEPKAQERRWRSRAELSADWFWETDADHRVTLLSDGIRAGLPIPHQRLLGRRLVEVPELRPAESGWSPLVTRLAQQELFAHFVCRLRADDGRESFIELDGRPRRADDGRFLGYEGVGRDVTARRHATEALRESLALVDALFDTMAVPVVLKDTAGRIVRANKAFHELAGDAAAAAGGPGADSLLGSGAADATAVAMHEAADRELLAHPGRRSYEVRHHTHAGRIIDMLVHKCTLVAADGGVKGIVGTVVDISEPKRAAAAMAQAKEAAEQANRAKSSFLATMSHELRTPLNAVIGAAQLLRTAAADEPLRASLVEAIEASGSALLGLIENIMDLSRIEAGALALAPADFDLIECAQAAVATLAVPARAKSLALACIVEPDVPAWRRGDPLRLRQVLLNLLGNAVKFTAAGGVVLRLARGARDTDLSIEVTDTGAGIAPAAIAHVFEPFRQADSGTTRRFGGSGLGLAIVRQLLQAMGGQIGVRSQVGRGSTFTIQLPLPLADEPPAAAGTNACTAAPSQPPGRAHTVLVVEDDATNRQIVSGMLRHAGYAVGTAVDGGQALRLLGERAWDLVLMDWQMPDMDGLEVTRRLRRGACGPLGQQVPIVALTANAFAEDRNACLAAGMNDYLSKPVDLGSLLAAVARWCGSAVPAPAGNPGEGSSSSDSSDSSDSSNSSDSSDSGISGGSGNCGSESKAAAAGAQSAPDFDPAVLARLPMVADGSDPGYAAEVIACFLERAPGLLADIHLAQQAGDTQRLARGVHTLKSASASVGAMALARSCAAQEARLRGATGPGSVDPAELNAMLARLQAALPQQGAQAAARTPPPGRGGASTPPCDRTLAA